MDVSRENAITMLAALGFKGGKALNVKRIESRMNKLLDVMDDDTEVEDETASEMLNAAVEALKAGDSIKVIFERPDEPDDAPEAQSEDAPETEADKSKPKKEAKKEPRKKGAPTNRKGRPYFAGQVIAECGVDSAVTPEMVQKVNTLFGKPNDVESEAWLLRARQFIAGYNSSWG